MNIDNIRSGLIDKILLINNEEILKALDSFITSNSESIELNNEQKTMLKMSDNDMKNGDLISQEAMNIRNLEWIDAM